MRDDANAAARAKACDCPTYPENQGPCDTSKPDMNGRYLYFEAGANGLCVFCDHTSACHDDGVAL